MKHIYRTILFALTVVLASSCLKMGLDKDLPTFDEAEITKVNFEYRWYDESKGLGHMVVASLKVENVNINSESAEITCDITVPAAGDKLPDAERAKVDLSNLVVYFDISTGAVMKPYNGAPVPGKPGDFSSKEFQYKVVAANGDSKIWTLKIGSLNK